MEKWYEIECNTSTSGKQVPFLSVINKEVVNISLPIQFTEIMIPGDPLPYGSVRIKNQITSKGCSSHGEELGSLLNLTGTPFYVSQRNTLTAVGCNNTASLTNVEPNIVGCKSSCGTVDNLIKDYFVQFSVYNYDCDEKCMENSCYGNKCCKAVMPDRVQQIVGVEIDNTTTSGCKVAFISDEAFSSSDPQRLHAKGYSTVELGWFFHTSNRSYLTSLGCCNSKGLVNLQRTTYSCGCDYDAFLSYARCSCTEGYEGNPYLLNGCRVSVRYRSSSGWGILKLVYEKLENHCTHCICLSHEERPCPQLIPSNDNQQRKHRRESRSPTRRSLERSSDQGRKKHRTQETFNTEYSEKREKIGRYSQPMSREYQREKNYMD